MPDEDSQRGRAAEEIAGTAARYGADLIVMGSRRLPVLVELPIGAR